MGLRQPSHLASCLPHANLVFDSTYIPWHFPYSLRSNFLPSLSLSLPLPSHLWPLHSSTFPVSASCTRKPATLDSFNNRSFHFHAPQYSAQTGRLQQTEGEFLAPQNLYTVAERVNPGPQDKGIGRGASFPSRQKIIWLLNSLER
jgi:hypothetical protein